jgi:hypothetical protein
MLTFWASPFTGTRSLMGHVLVLSSSGLPFGLALANLDFGDLFIDQTSENLEFNL